MIVRIAYGKKRGRIIERVGGDFLFLADVRFPVNGYLSRLVLTGPDNYKVRFY